MSKETTTRYFCDRCGREAACPCAGSLHRYRMRHGEVCDAELGRFLAGEAIEALPTEEAPIEPPEGPGDETDAPGDEGAEPTEGEDAPEGGMG